MWESEISTTCHLVKCSNHTANFKNTSCDSFHSECQAHALPESMPSTAYFCSYDTFINFCERNSLVGGCHMLFIWSKISFCKQDLNSKSFAYKGENNKLILDDSFFSYILKIFNEKFIGLPLLLYNFKIFTVICGSYKLLNK